LEFENFSPAIKEVQNYVSAMKQGFSLVENQGLVTNQTILKIQETLEGNNAGFRKIPGTALKNTQTGETIYLPPQDPAEILDLMSNLERFINEPELSDLDPWPDYQSFVFDSIRFAKAADSLPQQSYHPKQAGLLPPASRSSGEW
jgi:hypothetical protein